jgi:hypothetical protein
MFKLNQTIQICGQHVKGADVKVLTHGQTRSKVRIDGCEFYVDNTAFDKVNGVTLK